MKQVLSAIHARFRQLRNGEIVDNLAAQGITYRIAWGLESYRLREIALEQEQSVELAEALWAEDVRESKMLATRLFPIEEMSIEKAKCWIADTKYIELADQMCMNLLAKLPFAMTLAEELSAKDYKEAPIEIYTALKLATRIEAKNETVHDMADSLLKSDAPIFLKTAALWYNQTYEQI